MQTQNLSGGLMGMMGDPQQIISHLSQMSPQQLQQTAQAHMNDPMMMGLIKYVDNQNKSMQTAQQAKQQPQQQMPVNQQVAQGIGQPPPPPAQPQQPPGPPQGAMPPQGGQQPQAARPPMQAQPKVPPSLPEHSGIAQLPAGNIGMAGGGIVAFDKGGTTQDAGEGLANPNFMNAAAITLGLEGGQTTDSGGATNMGISQKGYPGMTPEQINGLSKNDVLRKYKNDYWDKIGGDDLAKRDPSYASIAFDTAINHGVSGAKKLMGQSDGSASSLLAQRQAAYDNLVEKKPEKYGAYADGWKNRLTNLAAAVTGSGSAQAAEQSGPPASAMPKPAPKGGGIFDLSKYKADPGYKPPHDVRLPVPMYGSNATQPADPRTVTGQLDALQAAGGQGAANQANYPGHGITEQEAQGVTDENGQLDRLMRNHPVTNIGGSSFDEPTAPAAAPQGDTQAAGAATTDDKGGLFGLSKRELLLAGLAGLKNAGPHWQNMVGSMGEGLVQAKNEQAAQAKAALENAQSQYFMNRGKYYDTMSDPKLQEMIHQHGLGNGLAGEKLVETHMKDWAAQNNMPLETLMKNPQMAQLYQAEEARYRANLPQQSGGATVASAPSPGWGAAKPNS